MRQLSIPKSDQTSKVRDAYIVFVIGHDES